MVGWLLQFLWLDRRMPSDPWWFLLVGPPIIGSIGPPGGLYVPDLATIRFEPFCRLLLRIRGSRWRATDVAAVLCGVFVNNSCE